MNITAHKTQIRTLKLGDPNFVITDGLTQTNRAGFEISGACPQNYAKVILDCIDRGWLKPIASVSERELIFMGLSNDT